MPVSHEDVVCTPTKYNGPKLKTPFHVFHVQPGHSQRISGPEDYITGLLSDVLPMVKLFKVSLSHLHYKHTYQPKAKGYRWARQLCSSWTPFTPAKCETLAGSSKTCIHVYKHDLVKWAQYSGYHWRVRAVTRVKIQTTDSIGRIIFGKYNSVIDLPTDHWIYAWWQRFCKFTTRFPQGLWWLIQYIATYTCSLSHKSHDKGTNRSLYNDKILLFAILPLGTPRSGLNRVKGALCVATIGPGSYMVHSTFKTYDYPTVQLTKATSCRSGILPKLKIRTTVHLIPDSYIRRMLVLN
jgi:hypothetical protein